jgi:CMP-N-acetylneuraminic acid synthetase
MIVALLIGRKGSQGLPGKNTISILGHPLAYFPMNAAKKTPEVDNIYLSTDDEKLIAIAKNTGISIIERPDYLCSNQALGEDVFVHGYNEIIKLFPNDELEFIVLLFCNAPTVDPSLLSKSIKILRENPNIDSAVSVSKYNMWSPLRARKEDKDGLLQPFVPFSVFGDPDNLNCDRDSQGDVWFADMSFSVVRPRCLEHLDEGLLPQKWMGNKIFPIKQWGGLDVDYEWQFPQVEFWLKKNRHIWDKNEK